MVNVITAASAFAALASLASADTFILGGNGYLTASRMDPIVSPGENVRGHVHLVVGGSKFRNVLNTPQEQLASKCSTTKVKADMSNYWVPQAYFMNKDGSFTAMSSGTRIYYQVQADAGGAKMHAFPKGFRMLSGLANYRDEGAERAKGVRISYNRDPSKNQHYWSFPPPAKAPDQTILTIFFPRCGWANQTLDTPDHFSHMTWPVQNADHDWAFDKTTCPDTHPVLYPQIVHETIYRLDDDMKRQWRTNEPNFVLANGDVTGVTYHGDFVNGWDTNVLQAAIEQCSNVGDELEKCAPFKGHLQGDERFDCRIEGAIPNEDVGYYKSIKKLPGCNPVWPWNGPLEKPKCDDTSKPGWIAPKVQYVGSMNAKGLPLALPGVDTSNPAKLSPVVGWRGEYGEPFTPRFEKWSLKADKTPVPYVLTQDKPIAQLLANPYTDKGGKSPLPAGTKPVKGHFGKPFDCMPGYVDSRIPCGTFWNSAANGGGKPAVANMAANVVLNAQVDATAAEAPADKAPAAVNAPVFMTPEPEVAQFEAVEASSGGGALPEPQMAGGVLNAEAPAADSQAEPKQCHKGRSSTKRRSRN